MNPDPSHLKNDLLEINRQLHAEADYLVYEQGLHNILCQFGVPHYTGSYELQLMTWRDLDIYLEAGQMSEKKFFELGTLLTERFSPVKMSFRNERLAQTPGLPNGLYWGIYLGDEKLGAWKIDLWCMDEQECRDRLAYCDGIARQLNAENRIAILRIKSKCWQHPAYRKAFSSAEIYKAVLEYGVRDFDEFSHWMKNIF